LLHRLLHSFVNDWASVQPHMISYLPFSDLYGAYLEFHASSPALYV